MKKYLLLLTLCTAGYSTYAQKSKEDRAEVREMFTTSCIDAATSEGLDEDLREMMVRYCNCSADKVLLEFSDKEIIGFNNLSEEEMTERVMPVIQECVDNLNAEITEYMKALMPPEPEEED